MEVVSDTRALLGEGPIWDPRHQVLWWVDILGKRLHCYTPHPTGERSYEMPQMIGTVVPRDAGGVALALEDGFARFDPTTEQLQMITNPEPERSTNRFNDGKCDPAGRFWAGSMSKTEAVGQGTLYSLDAHGQVRARLSGITVANGIVWTAEQTTMYYIDTPTMRIDAFDYDVTTGNIDRRRTVVQVPPELGYPDGMAIDVEGMLWVGMWGGWHVIRFDPITGNVVSKIKLPVANVTACAFGGSDLQDLYITTAQVGLTDEQRLAQPEAGQLFRIRADLPGLPSTGFAG